MGRRQIDPAVLQYFINIALPQIRLRPVFSWTPLPCTGALLSMMDTH